jgi:hypothetical protein
MCIHLDKYHNLKYNFNTCLSNKNFLIWKIPFEKKIPKCSKIYFIFFHKFLFFEKRNLLKF